MKQIFIFLIILGFVFVYPAISQEKIDLLILNKKYNKALSEIDSQFENNPSSALLLKKGMIFKQLKQFQNAAGVLLRASEMSPQNAEIFVELGESLSAISNHVDANRFYKKAWEIQPENLVLAGKYGSSLISVKDYPKAYDIFDIINQSDSSNVYWIKQHAFCASKINKRDQSIKLFEKVKLLNTRDLSVYVSLYNLYKGKRENKNARGVLYDGLEEFPESKSLLVKLGNFYFNQKEYAKAQNPYEQYLASGDSIFPILKNYGICLYFTEYEKEAIDILEQCVNILPNDPFVLFYLGLSHKKLAEYELAEQYVKVAIEAATPAYLPELYHHLGQIYGQQRKFEESIAALKESYKQDATNFEALFEIATTYEEYNYNKTLALNYYQTYLIEGGEAARNINYALTRIERIKEILFFDE